MKRVFEIKNITKDEILKAIEDSSFDIVKLFEEAEFEDDMDFFDKHCSTSYGMYAGLIALHDFLSTGKKMLNEDEKFKQEDFDYGIKVLNACLKRKAKVIGSDYTFVITKLEEE